MTADLQLLQGIWTVTSLEMDGGKMSAAMLENARVVIKGNRFTSNGMGSVYEGTLEVDESKKPRHLTMKFDAGPEKGNANLCIYKLDGDAWKMCIATRGSVRPSRFAAPAGTGIVVETLRRGDSTIQSKPESRARQKASSSTPGTAITELEGEWQMVSGIFDGKPMDPSETKWVRRVTQGNRTTVTAGPQVMMKFEFTLDSAYAPKQLDYHHTSGAAKGKTQRGIYSLDSDLLTVFVSSPGKPRPSHFESSPGTGTTLTVWKRLR
ncbi:MAG TPA: TIGR03067 domain-containing protein [Terriglobia bacterium]|nr:TIGR03067 domain-containing protein [Terriglobia bacterium]